VKRRAFRWFAILVVVVATLGTFAFTALIVVPRTSWGMERARNFALSWLEAQVQGTVTVERISGDGLLSMATLEGIEIVDADGHPFLTADSLTGRYNIVDLLRGRIVVSRADIWGAHVEVERWPGEAGWNFHRIFRREQAGEDGGGTARLVRLNNVGVHGATVEVIKPMANGEVVSGLAARYVVRDDANGRVQVMRFEDVSAKAEHVIWSRPGNTAKQIQVTSLAARIRIFDEAFPVHDVRGRIVIQDSITSLDIREFHTGSSFGSVTGRVINGAEGTHYDLEIDGESVDVRDVLWLDPRLPSTGRGSFDLHFASQPRQALLLQFSDIRFEAPGTNISGTFGYLTGSRPALTDVDLDVNALDLHWFQTEFADSILLDGNVTGSVRASGPLSAVRTSGNARLSPADYASADVQWSGTVRMDGIIAASGLGVDITGLDLALLDRFRPGLGLSGVVSGRFEADGRLRDGMELRAVMRHQRGVTSILDGGGTIRSIADALAMDLAFEATPLRLETVAAFVPGLDSLRGPATGSIVLSGRTDSLGVAGNVMTDGGRLAFDAIIDRPGIERHFVVNARSLSFTPSRVGLIAAEGEFAGEIVADVSGTSLETLRGPVRIDLDSALVRGVPVQRAHATVTFDAGRIVVDTADARIPGVRVGAHGAFGLIASRPDSLRIILDSESFEPLESILFDDFADPTQPRIAGSGRAVASLFGSIESFDGSIDASAQDVLYVGRTVEAVRIEATGSGLLRDNLRYDVTVRADSVNALDGFADSLFATLTRAGEDGEVRVLAFRDSLRSVNLASGFHQTETGSIWTLTELGFESGPGAWTLGSPAEIVVEGRTATIDGLTLLPSIGGAIVAAGTLAWSPAEPAAAVDPALDFDIDLRRVPFGLVPSILRPAGDIRGAIDGNMRIAGSTRSPIVNATFDVTGVEYEGAGLERVEVRMRYADLLLDGEVNAIVDGRQVLNGSGTLPVDLRFGPTERRLLERPITMSMVMETFPAAFMLGFTAGFSSVEGAFQGSIEANGMATSPELSGALVLVGGAATWDATGVRYVDAEGTFIMDRELTAELDFTARTINPRSGARGGTARLRGEIDLARPADPGFALQVVADRIQAAQRRDVEVVVSGTVDIGGQYTRPEIGGDITVNGGTLYLDEIYRQYMIVRLEDPLLFDVVDTTLISGPRALPRSSSPFLRNLRIENLNVSVASGSWLRGREINVEVDGALNVLYDRLGEGLLRMTGTLNAIRGTYRLEYPPITRSFEVREGTIEFPGTPGIDPNLDITALYTAPRSRDEPLDIIAQVTGTLQSPRVHLSSDAQPPISESDLASYLFLGAPTYALNAAGSGGAFGSLGRQVLTNTGLGYFASGLQTLGQSFGLVDYVGLSAAETAPGQNNSMGFFSGTKLELGRYLTPRLFVTYVQRLNSTSNDPGVRLEWRFIDTFTAELFALDRFARAPSFGLSRAIAARREYGLFLFREWGY
jgi:hypothetical protein